jgi:hypothetical protein
MYAVVNASLEDGYNVAFRIVTKPYSGLDFAIDTDD